MPANTITEVITQLTNIIAQSEAANNRAGYFAALYKKVTMVVASKITAGYFDDNPRMEQLDVVFANRYLDAFENYSQHTSCTAAWQLAFDTCNDWPPMVMHHLLTGMNAHIALDLGIATAIVAEGSAIENIHNDFNKINTILCDMIEEVKNCLFSMWPLSQFISKLNMGKIENDLAGFSMKIARDAAWQVAVDYSLCTDALAQQNYIAGRDKSVADFGSRLLHPGALLQTVAGIARVFEFGKVPDKIKKLGA